jgi:acyl carrier protein
LELGIALQKKYGLKFSEDNEVNRKHFATVQSLVEYVQQETQKIETNE